MPTPFVVERIDSNFTHVKTPTELKAGSSVWVVTLDGWLYKTQYEVYNLTSRYRFTYSRLGSGFMRGSLLRCFVECNPVPWNAYYVLAPLRASSGDVRDIAATLESKAAEQREKAIDPSRTNGQRQTACNESLRLYREAAILRRSKPRRPASAPAALASLFDLEPETT